MSDANPKGETPETTDPQADSDDDYQIEETADTSTATDAERGGEPKRVALQFPEGRELGVYKHLRHRGGDETVVLITAFGDGYQTLAYDISADGEILETEMVGSGFAPDEAHAISMCKYWLEQNPKGILGQADGGDGGEGGGALSGLTSMFGGD